MNTLYVTEKSSNEPIIAELGTLVDVKLSGLRWTDVQVTGEDDAMPVLKRMPAQGESHTLYVAARVGTVRLSAHGRARCQPGQLCPQFVIAWATTVTVIGAAKP